MASKQCLISFKGSATRLISAVVSGVASNEHSLYANHSAGSRQVRNPGCSVFGVGADSAPHSFF
jgi:hypothetical protein